MMVGISMPGRASRILLVLIALVASLLIVAIAGEDLGPAQAAGTPDLTVSVELQEETLHGGTTAVSAEIHNNTAVSGFNLSARAILPPGVSYVSGDIAPEQIPDAPGPGFTTIYVANMSDTPAGTTQTWDFVVTHDPGTYGVLEPFTIDTSFYTNIDPREVPTFDPVSGAPGDYTGSGEASDSTIIVAYTVEKSEPNLEAELMRGLHDHQTVYTITVTNNPLAESTGIEVNDWIASGIEFLGCGTDDNSTVGDEYGGSGPINPGNAPSVPDCLIPDTVETVQDPVGYPTGVYTHVVWGTGVAGITVPAGGVAAMQYVAAIPMNENTTVWDGPGGTPDTSGPQGSNIDNNNGPST
jgi:hypothetical protein